MHVIWKRPDGFHGADPRDFYVIEVCERSRLWLHKEENEWFPFQISGGWQDSEATKKLNLLVNLLSKEPKDWMNHLKTIYDNSMADDPGTFLGDIVSWLDSLKLHLKGDSWETEIMAQTLKEITMRLKANENQFKMPS